MAVSSGWSYRSEISGATTKVRVASTAPIPVLIQKSWLRWASERVLAWIAADDNPKSRKMSATPMIAMIIASRP